MAITIKNIAAQAGVSYQAVSAVLNNKNNCRVSPAKKEHILTIAKELGYKVNFGYKLMRGKDTHTVAIVVAMQQIESEEHIKLLVVKLMQQINKLGFATYFNNMMTPNKEQNLQEIRDLITRGAEHFIFIGSPIGHEEIEEELLKQNITFIGWNSFFSRDLGVDSFNASKKIFNYLYQKTNQIPKLIIPKKIPPNNSRYKALETLIKELNPKENIEDYLIFTEPVEWIEEDFTNKAYNLGYQAAKEAFTSQNPPKALACFTDPFALGVIAYCHQNNIIIGKDIFISGFNNIDAIKYNPFPIATASHPLEESIGVLLEQMTKKDSFKENIPLKVILPSC